jgi:hypothetical protein
VCQKLIMDLTGMPKPCSEYDVSILIKQLSEVHRNILLLNILLVVCYYIIYKLYNFNLQNKKVKAFFEICLIVQFVFNFMYIIVVFI